VRKSGTPESVEEDEAPIQKGDKAMNDEVVRKAAIRHFLAMVGMLIESARLLRDVGAGSNEAIDQAVAAMPLDQVSDMIRGFQSVHIDVEGTALAIEAYQSVGTPYGNTYGDLMKWREEQAGEGHEVEQAAERKEDKATEEDEDRAADEGMFDREEEQVLRTEYKRMNADLGDSVDS
jgi:hypothetical protein